MLAASGERWPQSAASIQRWGKKISPVRWTSGGSSETRTDETHRLGGAQRVIQIMQRFDSHGLVAAIGECGEALKGLIADGGIGGKRGHDKFKTRQIGVDGAITCAVRMACASGTPRTASSRAMAISSVSANGRPSTFSSRFQTRSRHAGPSGVNPVSRNAANKAAFWLAVLAREKPARRNASRAGARTARSASGRNNQNARA